MAFYTSVFSFKTAITCEMRTVKSSCGAFDAHQENENRNLRSGRKSLHSSPRGQSDERESSMSTGYRRVARRRT